MPGHCHAEAMSFVTDHFQRRGLYFISYLDLLIACVLVMLDCRSRLLRSLTLNIECVVFVFPVDVAGEQHSWPESTAVQSGITERRGKLNVIADVARRCDTGSQIGRTKFGLVKMGVHVP